jgi:hypothetical protein
LTGLIPPGSESPVSGPAPVMEYDDVRKLVLMYDRFSQELWELEPAEPRWTLLNQTGDVPPFLDSAELAHNSLTGATYLSGVFCLNASCDFPVNGGQGLWEWDPQTGQWTLLALTDFLTDIEGPDRAGGELVFDAQNDQLLYFMGRELLETGEANFSIQVLRWNPVGMFWADWTRTDSAPEGRNLVYSAGVEGGLLLHAGFKDEGASGTGVFNDTWLFNPATALWSDLTGDVLNTPERRTISAMAACAGSSMMLFGGRRNASPVTLDDTWIWESDTLAWRQVINFIGDVPEARSNHSLACVGDQVVMFSGCIYPAGPCVLSQGTWIFSMSQESWTRILPSGSGPEGRADAALATAEPHGVYLFGGLTNAGERLDDMWRWDMDGQIWTEVPRSDPWPAARVRNSMAYDPVSGLLLMSAGNQVEEGSVLWAFDPRQETWQPIAPRNLSQPPVDESNLLVRALDGSMYYYTGLNGSDHIAEFWALDRGRPAQMLSLSIDQLRIPLEAVMTGLDVRVVASGTAREIFFEPSGEGASLWGWSPSGWSLMDTHQAGPPDFEQLELSAASAQEVESLLSGPDNTLNLAITPAASGSIDGQVMVDYAEVHISYSLSDEP